MCAQELPDPEADFDAIEGAVMETARGRWFLTEFARRNRHANTQALLEAISRLETVEKQRSIEIHARLVTALESLSRLMAALQVTHGLRAPWTVSPESLGGPGGSREWPSEPLHMRSIETSDSQTKLTVNDYGIFSVGCRPTVDVDTGSDAQGPQLPDPALVPDQSPVVEGPPALDENLFPEIEGIGNGDPYSEKAPPRLSSTESFLQHCLGLSG